MIQVVIEGTDAVAATAALLALPGVSGSFEVSQEVEKEGTLAAIATLVGIVGGGMAIAEQIRKWYGEYRGNLESPRIEKVLIVTERGRIYLEGATTEEIAKALEPFAAKPFAAKPFATEPDATSSRFAPPRSIDVDG